MTVGEKIKVAREAKNIAQVDLATQVGIANKLCINMRMV